MVQSGTDGLFRRCRASSTPVVKDLMGAFLPLSVRHKVTASALPLPESSNHAWLLLLPYPFQLVKIISSTRHPRALPSSTE